MPAFEESRLHLGQQTTIICTGSLVMCRTLERMQQYGVQDAAASVPSIPEFPSLQLFIYPIHNKSIDTIDDLWYMDPLTVLYFQQTHFLDNGHIPSLNMEGTASQL
jgi:hypothetical protein